MKKKIIKKDKKRYENENEKNLGEINQLKN